MDMDWLLSGELGGDDDHKHFLDACALCNKPLESHRDIYMYRGDVPFCSEECRQEQIKIDEAAEKSRRRSRKAAAATAAAERESEPAGSSSPTRNEEIHARASTIVAG